eukprot:TRINITY_DN32776_c0_g1_i1.p1 TRINITY_DN32776_c0_g1~~TRINITY_DN32776_c0_g1_i1.p1  ORF type:complete len:363 (+),score=129.77 TRINITY_DN32776_c0_g1_i1:94-1089(+)
MFFLGLIVLAVALSAFMDADATTLVANALTDHKTAFKKQSVVLTGASAGIGARLVRDACTAGAAKVVITARRADRLADVQQQCLADAAAAGHPKPEVFVKAMDVTDVGQHQAFVDWTLASLGSSAIDHLVMNAGRSQRATGLETSLEDTRTLMELNYFATVHLTQVFAKEMVKAGKGRITVVSSLAGKIGVPLSSSYSATKFALQGYFEALRSELADTGVTVTMICPGPVVSEISQAAIKGKSWKALANENESRMTTERCTQLMVAAMSSGLYESWISPQPALVFTYVRQYAPGLTAMLGDKIGPARVKAFKEGTASMDVMKMLKDGILGK